MTLLKFTLLALGSLFVILDPIAVVPAFIAMTPNDTPAEKMRMARLASSVACGVLMFCAAFGKVIFQVMGVTLPAFQIAGSILLLRIALDMLHAERSKANETTEEVAAGAAKDDIAITPLGVPMLAGPGAISTALILLNQAHGAMQVGVLFASILVVCATCYATLALAIHGARYMSPLALKLATRLFGLFLAAMAVQFTINAIEQLIPLFQKQAAGVTSF